MSTIKVSRPVTGVAASWANFNGSGTVAIRDSMNVSSIVDNSVGVYSVNFSNDTSTANFTSAISSGGNTSTITSDISYQDWKSTSTCKVGHYENGDADDSDSMTLSINGDLA